MGRSETTSWSDDRRWWSCSPVAGGDASRNACKARSHDPFHRTGRAAAAAVRSPREPRPASFARSCCLGLRVHMYVVVPGALNEYLTTSWHDRPLEFKTFMHHDRSGRVALFAYVRPIHAPETARNSMDIVLYINAWMSTDVWTGIASRSVWKRYVLEVSSEDQVPKETRERERRDINETLQHDIYSIHNVTSRQRVHRSDGGI